MRAAVTSTRPQEGGPAKGAPVHLRAMSPEQLGELVQSAGFEPYRGRQLFQWLHRRGARTLEEMRNVPGPLREWLAANTALGGVAGADVTHHSSDGSMKFLFELDDGKKVESVLMPDTARDYWTFCLSSQVGCAVDCKFCVTGLNGFFRHLRTDEIVDQVLYARRYLHERQPKANFRNLVYMGMGEPLLNTVPVVESIRLLTSGEGVDLSPRRITVSTSGIVPGMIEFSRAQTGACLAVSLNAPTQEQREAIMPITRKYPLADVLDVVRRHPFAKNKRVTFEYVLLKDVTDREEDARALVPLLRGIPCKVNLIPFNPDAELPYGRPDEATINRFAAILAEANYTVSVRWSKALDVGGACGQLAGQKGQRASRRSSPSKASLPNS